MPFPPWFAILSENEIVTGATRTYLLEKSSALIGQNARINFLLASALAASKIDRVNVRIKI